MVEARGCNPRLCRFESCPQLQMMMDGIRYGEEVTFGDGVSCFNRGCRSHVRSPCEMCGRRGARGAASVRTGFLTVRNEEEVTGDYSVGGLGADCKFAARKG